ncbi:hemerythrin domain-containing protein [Rhodospira trueperi]|uniref:Hemerythrin-like metal-binding domain protein n=1 Tax=Rhodospira trueperi TaxID=69960 RepID=A0A1G7GX34_9PROT|nr:hemerythrin domain-containing protein [Rhodospira trueperi]SDE92707.1 hemerythrin-like metal-binding domain protein [Rhodospira trueperi]
MSDLRVDFDTTDRAETRQGHDALIAWSPDLSVSSPTLDLHHQILVGCLNRMILLQGNWRDCLPAVRRELALVMNYCRIHFFIEEAAMKLAQVPDETVQEHTAIHRRIVGKMSDAVGAFKSDPLGFPFDETLRFLNMWLVRHIQDEDKKHYAEALRAFHGVEVDLRKYKYAQISRKLKLKEDPTRTAAAGDTLSGRWVSIIESNMERRAFMARVFQDQGMRVSQANNVLDAPVLIDANMPEVVFLDWSMRDALPFARELYSKRNAAVVASYFGDPMEIIDQCDLEGVANILAHPASAVDIISVTRETLDALVPLRALVLERLEG